MPYYWQISGCLRINRDANLGDTLSANILIGATTPTGSNAGNTVYLGLADAEGNPAGLSTTL